jgi:hypothetical protein
MCALVVLGFVFWAVSYSQSTSGNSIGPVDVWEGPPSVANSFSFGNFSVADSHEREWEEILSMPTCVDVSSAIEEMIVARGNVLKTAAAGESQALVDAATRYGQAIDEVQSGLTRLKTRVPTHVFRQILDDMMFSGCAADPGMAFPDWELQEFASEIVE